MMFSRKGAKNAERFTSVRRSDFSREFQLMFATKVASTDNRNLCFHCASARDIGFNILFQAEALLRVL